MARATNHHRHPPQTGLLPRRPSAPFPSDFDSLRPSPPAAADSYGYFPPHYLPHPWQATAENTARFEYLRQDNINRPRHTMMNLSLINVSANISSLYDQRFSLYGPPPRFEHRRDHTNGHFYHYAIHPEDETLILQDISYQDLRPSTNGVSEETILKHMKTRVPEEIRFADDDVGEGGICVVCQDNLFQEKKKIATLACGHEYHAECIKKWLIQKNNCPICKATGLIVD